MLFLLISYLYLIVTYFFLLNSLLNFLMNLSHFNSALGFSWFLAFDFMFFILGVLWFSFSVWVFLYIIRNNFFMSSIFSFKGYYVNEDYMCNKDFFSFNEVLVMSNVVSKFGEEVMLISYKNNFSLNLISYDMEIIKLLPSFEFGYLSDLKDLALPVLTKGKKFPLMLGFLNGCPIYYIKGKVKNMPYNYYILYVTNKSNFTSRVYMILSNNMGEYYYGGVCIRYHKNNGLCSIFFENLGFVITRFESQLV